MNRDLEQIRKLAAQIKAGDFYHGDLETKCELIILLAERAEGSQR